MRKIQVLFFVVVALIGTSMSCNNETENSSNDTPFSECITAFEENNGLEVVTFNLEQFPKKNNTIMHVAGFLKYLNADVIAIQEITSEGALKELAAQMHGWEYVFTSSTESSISLGYLVKLSELELIEKETRVLFEEDNYRFPRAPLMIKLKHRASRNEYSLINLHLKAMGDEESMQRRLLASNKLQEYIDTYLSDDRVIVLGDFNDELVEDSPQQVVFHNFIVAEDYRFADMGMAQNSELFSYPDWPSHIDHILISNELFDAVDTTMTLRPDECFENYEAYISDHRPVVAVFELE